MFKQNEFRKYAIKHLGMGSHTLDDYGRKASQQLPQGMTPYIIEERRMNIQPLDVFSRLMMDRIIFLGTAIDNEVANIIQAQLLFLESTDNKRDIQIFINSPGGSVIAGLGMYDTMQYISPDIGTVCTGMAASFGAVLLLAGAKGKRAALPHARVMIHQPHGGMQGQVSDMEISYNLFKQLQKELYTIMSEHTGQSYEQIEEDSDRDKWFLAEEAKAYGLVDEVLRRK